MSDLRKRLGEQYRGAVFNFERWTLRSLDWTHDHCRMCNAQIREHAPPPDFEEGWVTRLPSVPLGKLASEEGYVFIPAPLDEGDLQQDWICPRCFSASAEEFGWRTGA